MARMGVVAREGARVAVAAAPHAEDTAAGMEVEQRVVHPGEDPEKDEEPKGCLQALSSVPIQRSSAEQARENKARGERGRPRRRARPTIDGVLLSLKRSP